MCFLSGYYVSTFLLEVLTISNIEKDFNVNGNIRCNQMLVIGPNGEQLGVKSKADALTLAEYAGFDLVLINSTSNPPVCKLMDYKKFTYEKKKKQKENEKKQREGNSELKEFRFTSYIEKHDFDTKVNNAKKHLEKNNKIKAVVRFKGRQLAHTELGEEVLKKFADALSDVSEIELQPKFEFKSIFMVLTPKKK